MKLENIDRATVLLESRKAIAKYLHMVSVSDICRIETESSGLWISTEERKALTGAVYCYLQSRIYEIERELEML